VAWRNAIGKRLRSGGPDSREPWRTVVGVVKPTRYRELTDPRATLYLPAAQFIVSAQSLVLRSAAPLSSVAGLARERVRALDPELRVMRVASFAERPEWSAVSCTASTRSIRCRWPEPRCCSSARALSPPGFRRAGRRASNPRRRCALSEPAEPGRPYASSD
jgi:hypothetical protein